MEVDGNYHGSKLKNQFVGVRESSTSKRISFLYLIARMSTRYVKGEYVGFCTK